MPEAVTVAIIAAAAAILGSCIALAGVLLSNWLAARERARDRELTLKREVFIPAADAVIALHATIMQLVDLDVSDADISKCVQELSPKLSAVDVVASASTVAATSRFLFRYMSAHAQIRIQRMFMKPLTGRNEALIGKLQSETSAGKIQGEAAERERQAKVREIVQGDTQKLEQDIAATFKFVRLCLNQAKDVGELVPGIIFALRDELGLPVDKQQYLAVWNESSARTYAFAERYVAGIEKFLGEIEAARRAK